MDIIISANDEIKKMIDEILLDKKNKVNPEIFRDMIISIANVEEKDGV